MSFERESVKAFPLFMFGNKPKIKGLFLFLLPKNKISMKREVRDEHYSVRCKKMQLPAWSDEMEEYSC